MKNKVALVTGGSSGIGAEVVCMLFALLLMVFNFFFLLFFVARLAF